MKGLRVARSQWLKRLLSPLFKYGKLGGVLWQLLLRRRGCVPKRVVSDLWRGARSGIRPRRLSCAKRLRTLEGDLQNLAIVADEPSGFRISKSDRPITAHLWQFEPGLSFIGSPSGCAGGEVRLSFVRDYDGPIVFMAEAILMGPRLKWSKSS